MNNDYKKINEKTKFKMQASPMLASVHWKFEDDTEKDIEGWFNEFNKLEVSIKDGLISEQTREGVLNIAKKYNIKDKERIGEISRIIREIFTRHLKEDDVVKRVVEKLKVKKENTKGFIVELKNLLAVIKKEGERIKKEDEKEQKNEIMAIIPAMEKYKEIGEQLISLEPIKLEIFSQPVRPSIKNWLEDYRETMGTEKSSIMSSSYLFTSKNAKDLMSEDRKKVSLILKSYNDNVKLVINPRERQVDFEQSLKNGYGKLKNEQGLKKKNEQAIFIKEKKEKVFTPKERMATETVSDRVIVDGDSDLENHEKEEVSLGKKFNQSSEVDLRNKEIKKESEKKERNLIDLSDY